MATLTEESRWPVWCSSCAHVGREISPSIRTNAIICSPADTMLTTSTVLSCSTVDIRVKVERRFNGRFRHIRVQLNRTKRSKSKWHRWLIGTYCIYPKMSEISLNIASFYNRNILESDYFLNLDCTLWIPNDWNKSTSELELRIYLAKCKKLRIEI